MPNSGRTTNNSVSSLDEQTSLINGLNGKDPQSSSSSNSSERKKQKKGNTPAAAAGSARQTTSTPTTPTTVTVTESVSQPGEATAPLNQAALQAQFVQQVPPQMAFPYFCPPMQGFYPHYQGFMPQMQDDSESLWESESVSIQRQDTHEISDDEDQEVPVSLPPRGGGEDLNFGSLKKGKFVVLLKSQCTKVKEDDKVGPPVDLALAKVINDFFEEAKTAGEMKRLSKLYPRIENVEGQVVPKLDQEIFTAIDQQVRGADVVMQNIQKGLVAAISAMAPVGTLLISRGDSDPELEALSAHVFYAFHLVALATNALSTKRRDQMRPCLQQTYAKAMAKGPEGASKWLFGGNLSETARKCEVAKKIGEKLLKGKGQPKQGANAHPQQQQQKRGAGGQQNQFKNFKYTNNQDWQKWNKQGQNKQFGYQMQYQQPFMTPQQFQSFRAPAPRQEAPVPQQKQDFRPGGPRK